MCGIAGIAAIDSGVTPSSDALRRMTGVLAHRGPDGEGFFEADGIALGHRRLSIIDLAGGDQPIFNETGDVVIVFNGEIYNYKELQQSLRANGHTLSTSTDTEVIVHLYEDYGPTFVDHLNGMFAIALWDAKRKRLVLARDRMGEKPLYFAELSGTLVFGSELKSLLEVPGLEQTIDIEALDDYLAYGYVPAPRTIFKNVFKLPAAHRLILESGRYVTERYWTVDDEPAPVPNSEAEAIAALRELLQDAVRIRLRSDVPVGAFLSGGIDSSLIVALASAAAVEPLQTFTIGFPGANQDESGDAAVLAKHFGTRHTTIPIDEVDLSLLPTLVSQFDEPFADPSSVPTFHVTREASRFVKVCLSGDGGDELFGGYRRYRPEPFEPFINRMPQFVRRGGFGTAAKLVPSSLPGAGWLDRMSVDGARRLQRKVGIFSQAERLALWRPEYREALQDDAAYLAAFYDEAPGTDLERRMATDRQTYMPEDVLTKVDRDSMANSLEVRVPLLDHRIAALSTRLPYDLKFRNGTGKYALREVLRGLVPDEVFNRPKRGFGMPLRDWQESGKLDPFLSQLRASDSHVAKFLSRRALDKLLERGGTTSRDTSSRLWALLWLEIWLRDQAPQN